MSYLKHKVPDALEDLTDGDGADVSLGAVTLKGHIIPSQNAAYDLGNAEYKIRHLFLSDNSLWIGESHKMSIEGGSLKINKRRFDEVPGGIMAAGGDAPGALAFSGKSTIEELTLQDWEAYLRNVSGDPSKSVGEVFGTNDFIVENSEEMMMSTYTNTGAGSEDMPILSFDTNMFSGGRLTLQVKSGTELTMKEYMFLAASTGGQMNSGASMGSYDVLGYTTKVKVDLGTQMATLIVQTGDSTTPGTEFKIMVQVNLLPVI